MIDSDCKSAVQVDCNRLYKSTVWLVWNGSRNALNSTRRLISLGSIKPDFNWIIKLSFTTNATAELVCFFIPKAILNLFLIESLYIP